MSDSGGDYSMEQFDPVKDAAFAEAEQARELFYVVQTCACGNKTFRRVKGDVVCSECGEVRYHETRPGVCDRVCNFPFCN
jgi:hypothetical protein